ncbi:MAG: hypothetical protein HY903_09915 [Deltaproteobacteria bacterium]|nr:hypothetical protein [Deltaproteobacteria bacterium]
MAGIIATAAPGVSASGEYLHNIASFDGDVEISPSALVYDRSAGELLVIDASAGGVLAFTAAGMKVGAFGDEARLGWIQSLAVLNAEGDYAVLVSKPGEPLDLLRLNYRGELVGSIILTGVPAGSAKGPDASAVFVARDRLYLANTGTKKVRVFSKTGAYESTVDLSSSLKLTDEELRDHGIGSLSVDKDGNILFTVPTLYAAFIVSPAGEVKSFGQKGSRPGRFNVAGGIVRDDAGSIYVTDVLRAVVMVFGPDLKFRGELGGRGFAPGHLIGPRAIAVGDGVVFVAQGAKRGVSVFRIVNHLGV